MKDFYSGLKEVWSPQTKQSVHLKSSDEVEPFTDSKSVMARWCELLNLHAVIEPESLENESGDGIPAEVCKYGGTYLSSRLHQGITKI